MANTTKMLSREEETRLLDAYFENGDTEARNRLVMAYMPLAKKTAAAFERNGKASYEDLLNEACVGLTESIDRFDRKRGSRLSTLAVFYIRSALMRYLMDTHCVVRVGTNLPDKKVFSNLRRLVAEIEERNGGRAITDEDRAEIANRLNVPIEAVKRMEARVFANDVSVAPTDVLPEDDEGPSRSSGTGVIAVRGEQEDVERSIDATILFARIDEIARENFSDRDLDIVRARLAGDMTRARFEDLGQRHDISVERIRQIQRNGMRKIAEILRSQGITGIDQVCL